jgi:hypothetical protein
VRLLLTAVLLVALGVACSPDPGPATPPVPDAGPQPEPKKCVGGVILEDGTCVAKCDKSKCVPGNTCVDNKCTLECTAHHQCKQYTQSCLASKEDDTERAIFVCTDVPLVEYGDPCPFGTGCAGVCESAGPGDARSYCTVDCRKDADCPGGYECGWVRDPRNICGTNVGNNTACGTTDQPCVPPEQVTAENGLSSDSFCLQQQRCLKREVCAPCQTDVDCSWGFNLACVQLLDGKRCLQRCGQSTDCEQDKVCSGGFCSPQTDACTGNQFCSPCRYDLDCPAPYVCGKLHGNERGCVHPRTTGFCTSNSQCPLTPNGKQGLCLAPYQGATSGFCSAPQTKGVDEFGNQIEYLSCY